MSLKEYKAKRNFARTSEPKGKVNGWRGKKLRFVVQKHAATRLHYDFRLEMEGVLKSWAVPKGFPTKKGDRRLAVQVEDHPIKYGGFEGTIPEGNYGAGTVMLWDRGTYEVSGGDAVKALAAGKLHLILKGKKLNGEWTLVRMRRRDNADKPQWLLVKSSGDVPEFSQRAENHSVLTKRTMEQIASANGEQWQSNRPASTPKSRLRERLDRIRARKTSTPTLPAPELETDRLPRRKPAFVEPMKARLSDKLPRGAEWIYEIKFDGIRALAMKKGNVAQLISRNQKDLSERFGTIAKAIQNLPAGEAVLDGEVVALDEEGRPSFQLLQNSQQPGAKPPIVFYVFDMIQLDGKDLTGLALLKRKAIVEALLANAADPIRFSGSIQADSDKVIREMKARGLEGLVAKKRDSRYEVGQRSGAWIKFKWTNEQEFVIAGYTEPQGARSYFGAILVGYFEGEELMFAAKVGTGFDHKTLKMLYEKFQKLRQTACPFANLPEKRGAHGGGMIASEMRRCTWIKPTLVCQVRFAEWTRDGHLRQPAFLGLREDKQTKEVVREQAA